MAPRLLSRPASKGGKSGHKLKQTNDIKAKRKSRPVTPRGPRTATRAKPDTLGWRIQRCRKALNLTQKDLAAKVGVVQASVSAWECGKVEAANIPARTLKQVAIALETTEAHLRTGQETRGAAEGVTIEVQLHMPSKHTEVQSMAREGLASESLTLAQAQKLLREAVKAGKPVWVVVG